VAKQRAARIRRVMDGAFGVWRLAFGVWRLAFGVWRLAFGVWRLAFGVWLILDDRNRGNCKHAQRQFAVLLEVWDVVDLWPAAEWHGAPNFLGA
jgi:hypothetical protein